MWSNGFFTVSCDGRGCNETVQVSFEHRISEAERELEDKHGWIMREEGDFCPKCAKIVMNHGPTSNT